MDVTQKYVNKERIPIEAVYVFPVEPDSAVVEVSVRLEERIVKTVVREKRVAREEYEESVKGRQTAVLLDQTQPDIFQMKVGHLSPGSGCQVTVRYISELSVEDRKTRITIPTTVAPRYVPASDRTEAAGTVANIQYDCKAPAKMRMKLRTIMKTKIYK